MSTARVFWFLATPVCSATRLQAIEIEFVPIYMENRMLLSRKTITESISVRRVQNQLLDWVGNAHTGNSKSLASGDLLTLFIVRMSPNSVCCCCLQRFAVAGCVACCVSDRAVPHRFTCLFYARVASRPTRLYYGPLMAARKYRRLQ